MTGHTYIKQIKLIQRHMVHFLFIKTAVKQTIDRLKNKYVINFIFFRKTECRIQAALTKKKGKWGLTLTGVVEI